MICYHKTGTLKKLLEITSKIDSLAKKNEELTSRVSVEQNASKILQEAFKTMSSKLIELERQHHKVERSMWRECLDFSGIPNSVAPKDLGNSYYIFWRKSVLILTNDILLLVIGWERQIEQF